MYNLYFDFSLVYEKFEFENTKTDPSLTLKNFIHYLLFSPIFLPANSKNKKREYRQGELRRPPVT